MEGVSSKKTQKSKERDSGILGGWRDIAASFYLSLSYPGFLLWFLLLFINKTFTGHVYIQSGNSTSSELNWMLNILAYAALIYIILDLLLKEQMLPLNAAISTILWVFMGYAFIRFTPTLGISSLTTMRMRFAYFIEYHPLLFLSLGISSLYQFTAAIKLTIQKKMEVGVSLNFFSFFIFLWTFLIGLLYPFIINWGIYIPIAILSSIIIVMYFPHNLSVPSLFRRIKEYEKAIIELIISEKKNTPQSEQNGDESRTKKEHNGEGANPDKDIPAAEISDDEIKSRIRIIPKRNLIIGPLLAIIFSLLMYFSAYISVIPFYFTTINIALVYFSIGALIFEILAIIIAYFTYLHEEVGKNGPSMAASDCEPVLSESTERKCIKIIPWYKYSFTSIVFLWIIALWMYLYYNFSNSTYKTDAPLLVGVFMGGFAFSGIIRSVFAIYENFKRAEDWGHSRGVPFYARIHALGRSTIPPLILFIANWGFQEGLGDQTFKTGFKQGLIYGLTLIPVICSIILTVIVYERKKSMPHISLIRIHFSQHFKRIAAFGASRNKRIVQGILLMFILVFSGYLMMFHDPLLNNSLNNGALSPGNSENHVFYNGSQDITEYPKVLGMVGECYVIEESPLTKVGERTVFAPSAFKNSILGHSESAHVALLGEPGGILRKKMAKNEFEVIQLVISNGGTTPIEINDIVVMNSSYAGLDSLFAGPPHIKTWKGQPWEWARITPYFVKEIRSGFPYVLYPLPYEIINGTRTENGYLSGDGFHRDTITQAPRDDVIYFKTPDIGGIQYYKGQNATAPKPIIKPFSSIALWLTLYAPPDTAPGNYSDALSIITDKHIFNFTITTQVWNFSIPETPTFKTAIGNRAVYYLDNRDEWNKNFLAHRMSPYFPFNLRNLYSRNGTQITFNFTEFEFDLKNAIDNGLTSFRINFAPAPIDDTAFTEEFNQTAISFYSQLGEFLDNHTINDGTNRTWLDLVLVYAMDEPGEDDYPYFNKWSELVHRAYPGLKILLTEQVEPEINDSVDIWCPFIDNVKPANIALQKAAGREYWYYTCCSVSNEPTVLYVDPAINHLTLFWVGWAFDMDGYLNWDAAAYVDRDCYDPYHLGYNEVGDATMLLNDANLKPVNTIVWELMREGEEDVEYFNLLQQLNPDSPLLHRIREHWSTFSGYSQSILDYHAVREMVGQEIDTLINSA